MTEYLAEVVARPHLRKPRQEIIRLTREAREKRHHLVRQVHIGLPNLIPPMPPPRRQTFPWMGGDLDNQSPPTNHHDFDHFLRRMWRGERDRHSPSPPPPLPPPLTNSRFGSRDRRSLPSRSRSNRNQSRDEDPSLRHILEMSRMEYEAEQQLKKGISVSCAVKVQSNE